MKRRTFGASLVAGVSSLFLSKEKAVARSPRIKVGTIYIPTTAEEFAGIVLGSLGKLTCARYSDNFSISGDDASRGIKLERYCVAFRQTKCFRARELVIVPLSAQRQIFEPGKEHAERAFYVETAVEVGRLFRDWIDGRECVICRLAVIPARLGVDCAVAASSVASVRVCKSPMFEPSAEHRVEDQWPEGEIAAVSVDMIIGFFDKSKQKAE